MARNSTPLDRDRIVHAAMAFVREHGVEALSMRKLGAALHVEAMTLYHYVPSKDALLDLLVERLVLQAADDPGTRGGTWRKQLEGFTRRFRRGLLACPRVVPLLAARPVRSAAAMARFAAAIEGLVHEGFTPTEAYCTLNALALLATSHALAAAGHEAPGRRPADEAAESAYVGDVTRLFKNREAFARRHDTLFEFALTAFLDGVAARRRQAR